MPQKPLSKIIFLIILLSCIFLRISKLSQNPPSLFSDEVDAGYQAMVFNQCQSDYQGNKFPTHFQSFSDWRTPLQIYSIAIAQKFFKISEFSTRLPSAFYGILSTIVFYLLVKLISKKQNIALLAFALISFSPWHIHYSRIGFEATGMLFTYLLGLYFFLKFIKTPHFKNLFFSAVSFILSLYFYSTAKLFLIITAISILLFYSKQVFAKISKKQIIGLTLALLLFISPMLVDTIKGRSGYRFSYINIFTDPATAEQIDRDRYQDAIKTHGLQVGLETSLSSKLFHNKPLNWANKFIKNYLLSFSTDFLFIKGDTNLRHGFGQQGYFFPPELLFILLGVSSYLFIHHKDNNRQSLFLLVLLFASPIPFALTRDSNSAHATRLFLTLTFLTFFSAIGLSTLLKSKIIYPFIALYAFFFINFHHFYYYHYPQISAVDWHLGMKQAVIDAKNLGYRNTYFSSYPESFLPFYLFWNKHLPSDCNFNRFISRQDDVGLTGLSTKGNFFGHIEWKDFLKIAPQDSLFVISQNELPQIEKQLTKSINIIKKIGNPQDLPPIILFNLN